MASMDVDADKTNHDNDAVLALLSFHNYSQDVVGTNSNGKSSNNASGNEGVFQEKDQQDHQQKVQLQWNDTDLDVAMSLRMLGKSNQNHDMQVHSTMTTTKRAKKSMQRTTAADIDIVSNSTIENGNTSISSVRSSGAAQGNKEVKTRQTKLSSSNHPTMTMEVKEKTRKTRKSSKGTVPKVCAKKSKNGNDQDNEKSDLLTLKEIQNDPTSHSIQQHSDTIHPPSGGCKPRHNNTANDTTALTKIEQTITSTSLDKNSKKRIISSQRGQDAIKLDKDSDTELNEEELQDKESDAEYDYLRNDTEDQMIIDTSTSSFGLVATKKQKVQKAEQQQQQKHQPIKCDLTTVTTSSSSSSNCSSSSSSCVQKMQHRYNRADTAAQQQFFGTNATSTKTDPKSLAVPSSYSSSSSCTPHSPYTRTNIVDSAMVYSSNNATSIREQSNAPSLISPTTPVSKITTSSTAIMHQGIEEMKRHFDNNKDASDDQVSTQRNRDTTIQCSNSNYNTNADQLRHQVLQSQMHYNKDDGDVKRQQQPQQPYQQFSRHRMELLDDEQHHQRQMMMLDPRMVADYEGIDELELLRRYRLRQHMMMLREEELYLRQRQQQEEEKLSRSDSDDTAQQDPNDKPDVQRMLLLRELQMQQRRQQELLLLQQSKHQHHGLNNNDYELMTSAGTRQLILHELARRRELELFSQQQHQNPIHVKHGMVPKPSHPKYDRIEDTVDENSSRSNRSNSVQFVHAQQQREDDEMAHRIQEELRRRNVAQLTYAREQHTAGNDNEPGIVEELERRRRHEEEEQRIMKNAPKSVINGRNLPIVPSLLKEVEEVDATSRQDIERLKERAMFFARYHQLQEQQQQQRNGTQSVPSIGLNRSITPCSTSTATGSGLGGSNTAERKEPKIKDDDINVVDKGIQMKKLLELRGMMPMKNNNNNNNNSTNHNSMMMQLSSSSTPPTLSLLEQKRQHLLHRLQHEHQLQQQQFQHY